MKIILKISLFVYSQIAKIPIKYLYLFSNAFSTFASILFFLPFAKQVRRNLKMAFPQLTDKERKELSKRYYQCAVDFGIETIYGFTRDTSGTFIIDFTNIEELLNVKDKIIFCYSGHFLNYELLTRLPLYYPDFTMYDFYKPSGIPMLDDYITDVRSKYGANLIPTTSPLRKILEIYNSRNVENKHIIIGSLADIMPSGSSFNYSQLFGKEILTYTGSEKIGRKINAVFYYANITRARRGHYHVSFVQLKPDDFSENPNAITDNFYRCLEKNIREQPELWMLWASDRFR